MTIYMNYIGPRLYRLWADHDPEMVKFAEDHHIPASWSYRVESNNRYRPWIRCYDVKERRYHEMRNSKVEEMAFILYCRSIKGVAAKPGDSLPGMGVFPPAGPEEATAANWRPPNVPQLIASPVPPETMTLPVASNINDGTTYVALAERLRLLRGSRTIKAMAQLTGLNVSTIGKLEAGQSNPTMITLQKYHVGLNIPLSQVLSGTVVSSEDVGKAVNLRDAAMQALKRLDDHSSGVSMRDLGIVRRYIGYLELKHRRHLEQIEGLRKKVTTS